MAGAALALPFVPVPVLAASSFPVTVTDALGRTVVVPRRPRRILPIFASNVEILCAIDGPDRIVGIEDWTRFPPEVMGRPRIGGRLGFSAEAVVGLAPDLVVVTPARQAVHQLLRPLDEVGIPLVVFHHPDIKAVLANIATMGRLIGREDVAADLRGRLDARMGAIARQVAGRPRPRVYLETGDNGNGGYQSVRPGSYCDDILLRAGADNVFAGRDHLSQVSGEAVLAADPDVILVAAATLPDVAGRPGWDGLRAVRTGRVHACPRAELLIPGPRVVDGIDRLARLFQDNGGR